MMFWKGQNDVDSKKISGCRSSGDEQVEHRGLLRRWKCTVPCNNDGYMSLCMHARALQLHLTLCDPMDRSLLCSCVHGIFLARILQWVATHPSRRCSWPRDWTCVSWAPCIAGEYLIVESQGKSQMLLYIRPNRENTTSRVTLNVNYELWVIMILVYIYLWQKKKYHFGEWYW